MTDVCNPKIDLDCDGTVAAWETQDDAPRQIYGSLAAFNTVISIYTFFENGYAAEYGLSFSSIRTAGMSLFLLFGIVFSFSNLVTYSLSYGKGNLTYLFYISSIVSRTFYTTGYWISPLLLLIHVGTREEVNATDGSTSSLIFMAFLGAATLFLEFMFKEEMDFWLIRQLYVNENVKDAFKRVTDRNVPLYGEYPGMPAAEMNQDDDSELSESKDPIGW